jgi:excisionase family DNA binding protein
VTPRLAYSVGEAAKAMSVSVRSLRYLMQTGRLGFARIGRRVVIPHAELERLLRRRSVKATVFLDGDESIRPARNADTGASRLRREAPERGAVRPAPTDGGTFDDTTSASR